MLVKIFQRLGINFLTFLFILAMSFGLMKIVPGNPYEGERSLSPQALSALKEKYDFTFSEYIWGFFSRGDLRYSYKHRDLEVKEILRSALPYSLELGFLALSAALLLGILWGTLAAIMRGTWLESMALVIALIGITVPNFVVGPILQWIFALQWNWTPVAGWSSLNSKILPVAALSLMYIAYITRITRGSLLETLHKDFIRTARAKGLSKFQIVSRHVFRNSLIPLVNYLGPASAAVLTGTLVIEKIFNIPGLGRYFVESALQRDYPVALGVLIVYSAMLLLFNLITDILQTWIDPRIQL